MREERKEEGKPIVGLWDGVEVMGEDDVALSATGV